MATNEDTAPACSPVPYRVDAGIFILDATGRLVAKTAPTRLWWCGTAEDNARFIVRACNAHQGLRQASQELYDALCRHLIEDIPDSELPEDLLKAMGALEEAWRKADGTEHGDHGTP